MKVVIIGWWPAGSTLWNYLVSKTDFDVTIIEKEIFPRHHVGESLQPDVIRSLEEMEIPISELSGFPKKYGAIYKWGLHNDRWSVLYSKELDELYDRNETLDDISHYEHGFNVERAKFDAILLKYQQRVFSYILKMVKDQDLTNDIFQEVWTKPTDGQYYFKKAHAFSYAMAVVVHMNLICESVT